MDNTETRSVAHAINFRICKRDYLTVSLINLIGCTKEWEERHSFVIPHFSFGEEGGQVNKVKQILISYVVVQLPR